MATVTAQLERHSGAGSRIGDLVVEIASQSLDTACVLRLEPAWERGVGPRQVSYYWVFDQSGSSAPWTIGHREGLIGPPIVPLPSGETVVMRIPVPGGGADESQLAGYEWAVSVVVGTCPPSDSMPYGVDEPLSIYFATGQGVDREITLHQVDRQMLFSVPAGGVQRKAF